MSLEGVFLIQNFSATDVRGNFVKTFNADFLKGQNIDFQIKESYFSVSKKDVIRGLHFQKPPYDHQKMVFVVVGSVLDVVVDLRKNSKTYLQHIVIELSAENHDAVYIPKGLAHGFKSLEDGTIMMYNVGSVYNPVNDTGIRYDSIGLDWQVEKPILSERDLGFPTLEDFVKTNPFF